MANKILLIGTGLIKAESVIENNVDDKILSKVIANVQETELKGILQKNLYSSVCDEVKKKIDDNTYVFSDLYDQLINDYIQPFLLHSVIAQFIAINNYKVSNKGIQKLNDNSSTAISSNEVEYIKNYYDNISSTYKKNLIDFLEEQKLLERNSDKDSVSNSIGWYLEGCKNLTANTTSSTSILSAETDPIWFAQKANYYTKADVDSLITDVQPYIIEVIIGQQGATDLGLVAGITTYSNSKFINKSVEIIRGGINLPMQDPLDGNSYATKPLASDTITFSDALTNGEYLKIKTIKTI